MKIAGLYIPIRILKAQKVFNLTNEINKREFLINIIFNTIKKNKLPQNIMFKKDTQKFFWGFFNAIFILGETVMLAATVTKKRIQMFGHQNSFLSSPKGHICFIGQCKYHHF